MHLNPNGGGRDGGSASIASTVGTVALLKCISLCTDVVNGSLEIVLRA